MQDFNQKANPLEAPMSKRAVPIIALLIGIPSLLSHPPKE